MIHEFKSFKKDNLTVKIYKETRTIGIVAANYVASELISAIKLKGSANHYPLVGLNKFQI